MATSTKVHNEPPPGIRLRPLLLSDLATLLDIHDKIFPHGNEDPSLFYEQMLSNEDSDDKMMTLGAVDSSRPDDKSDEIIGYVVTTKIVNASDSEIADNIVAAGESSDKLDNKSLVYVMWLGVLEAYRNRGIGTYLMREVIKYASRIPTCVGIYLHAVAENKAAIKLYKKLKFKCVRRLRNYYPINGKLYDGLLFVHCLNGARCYRSPKYIFVNIFIDVVTLMLGHVRSGLKSVGTRLRKIKQESQHRS
ncbi:histone acetyltransferase MCC1-like isoform X1 [Arachis stenosperma]|nr:histone acetyltransferase MCC1-like isoform X1 [Arachis stenosperma]